MRVEDLVFEVRDSSLARVGQLTPADGLTSFKATLRLNNVGSWQIDIPEGRPLADILRAPGSGIIVTNTLTNTVILSGPTVAATKTSDSGESVALWSIRGTDDSVILGERLAYPTPTSADVTAQTSAYDAVSAVKASTAMIGYVRRNLVAGVAPAARAITGLTTVTDPVAGSTISYAARFDMLGQVLTDIANVDGLAFDIYQSGSALMFNVWAPVDRSKTIRLDVANNTLQKATYGYGYGMSRAIVGGQGEGAARTFTEVSTSTSLQTESSFGRRVEKFIDQRQESDSAKLVTAGQATLADAGGLITSVDVVPTSDTTMRPLVDFTLGDKVSVVVASQEVAAVITQMSVSVTDMGVYVGITVGNPVGVDFEAITAKRQTDTSSRVSALEVLDARPTVMPVANGGTGASTLAAGGYLKGNGTSAVTSQVGIPGSDIVGYMSPNYIINGGFDIWQRGTSVSVSPGASNIFIADRWNMFNNVSGSTVTVSQQTFTPGAAPVAGYEAGNFLRATMSGYSSSYLFIGQKIEDVRTLAGQTATISFWAKSSVAASMLLDYVQWFGTGGSSLVNNSVGTPSLTTSWQRFTYTVSIPSLSGKTIGTGSSLEFRFNIGVNASVDIWGVQVEQGSVATPFRRNANSLQGELAACQRYYIRWNAASSASTRFATGFQLSTTLAEAMFQLPVVMRAYPAISYDALYWTDGVGFNAAVSAVSLYLGGGTQNFSVLVTYAANGVARQAGMLSGTGSTTGQTNYFAFSAEL